MQWYCVITNVGLLYYEDPTKKPKNLIPIIDTKILELKENVYHRKYVFKIKCYQDSYIFAASSKPDYDQWIKEFTNL